jgi:hypothetical protein
MYRCGRHLRVARHIAASLLAGVLLPGCATLGGSGPPFALGLQGAKHRSIKDETASQAAAPERRLAAQPPPAAPPPRPFRPAAAPDAPACATGSACLTELKAMIADPDRSWIGRPQAPADFATGTRLFAYRALHGRLSCRELDLALEETASADRTFRAPVQGVTPAQAGGVLALNTQVDGELRTERARRCRRG